VIFAVDPGREKVGTVLYRVGEGILERRVLSRDEFPTYLSSVDNRFGVDLILIGNGTGSDYIKDLAIKKEKRFSLVSEVKSTEEARKLFFAGNPPKGLKKLVPRGLLTPRVEIDDYAAEVILLRFLKKYAEKEGV